MQQQRERGRPFLLELAEGEVLCRLDGPPQGPLVLLIHGATVPHWEFDRLVPFLSRAGLQTLRFDLYGHGASARPRLPYRRGLFVRQTQDLLSALGQPRLKAVLGHSMGAAIAADLAAQLGGDSKPQTLILVAPLLDFSARNPFRRILRLPLAGELFMTLIGRPGLIYRRHRRYTAIGQPELSARFRKQVRLAGFWRALLAMERDGALGDQTSAYRRAAAAGFRPIIIHGEADSIVPAEDISATAGCFEHSRIIRFPDLAHNLMLTDPEPIAACITQALGLQ